MNSLRTGGNDCSDRTNLKVDRSLLERLIHDRYLDNDRAISASWRQLKTVGRAQWRIRSTRLLAYVCFRWEWKGREDTVCVYESSPLFVSWASLEVIIRVLFKPVYITLSCCSNFTCYGCSQHTAAIKLRQAVLIYVEYHFPDISTLQGVIIILFSGVIDLAAAWV